MKQLLRIYVDLEPFLYREHCINVIIENILQFNEDQAGTCLLSDFLCFPH